MWTHFPARSFPSDSYISEKHKMTSNVQNLKKLYDDFRNNNAYLKGNID